MFARNKKMTFTIEDLPLEIQKKIWDEATCVARDCRNEITHLQRDNRKSTCPWKKEIAKELKIIERKCEKGKHYCDYMHYLTQYKLGECEKEPWPYYKPKYRKCKSCGDMAIHVEEPHWKKICIDCYKDKNHPQLANLRCLRHGRY